MKYRIQVGGLGTTGSFQLDIGHGIDAWRTRKIGVASTAELLQTILEEVPRLAGRVTVTSDQSDKSDGPKAWDVEIEDGTPELLWVNSRHGGGMGLCGWASPSVSVVEFPPTDQARSQIESVLSEVYLPEGVQIWMTSPHRWLGGRRAVDLIAEGRATEVLAAANRLIDGAW